MKKTCNTLSGEHLFDGFHVINKDERLVKVVDKKDAISKTENYDIMFKKCSICGVIDDSEKIERITKTKYNPKDEDKLERRNGEYYKGPWYNPSRYLFNSVTGEFERYYPDGWIY